MDHLDHLMVCHVLAELTVDQATQVALVPEVHQFVVVGQLDDVAVDFQVDGHRAAVQGCAAQPDDVLGERVPVGLCVQDFCVHNLAGVAGFDIVLRHKARVN